MNTQPPRRPPGANHLATAIGCCLGLPATLLFLYFAYTLFAALSEGVATLF